MAFTYAVFAQTAALLDVGEKSCKLLDPNATHTVKLRLDSQEIKDIIMLAISCKQRTKTAQSDNQTRKVSKWPWLKEGLHMDPTEFWRRTLKSPHPSCKRPRTHPITGHCHSLYTSYIE